MGRKPFLTASLHHLSPEERSRMLGTHFPDPFEPALRYHESSSFHPDLMSFQAPRSAYLLPDHRRLRTGEKLDLPPEESLPPLSASLGDVIHRRRSRYAFGGEVRLEELAALLTGGLGITARKEVKDGAGQTYVLQLRGYPSGGALYPVETWVVMNRVTGEGAGVYRFSAPDRCLWKVPDLSLRPEDIAAWTPGTDPDRNPLYSAEDFTEAAAFLLLVADFSCQADKYGPRAYRLALLEAGHMAQNLLLAATALDLFAVPIAGFYDGRANQALRLDPRRQALVYLIPVGRPKEESQTP
ncbi:SagB/ThcOx family dehydrogenase [Staphylospora marina]|uniref:SagB/ThcOx family dehydrogenase n=1 Tax=Staphylospora marina TaxID=2490858 RepID=UPI000F5BA744|nr:SagB/ThcOx family dehydrogenase [Staphylospora marina]